MFVGYSWNLASADPAQISVAAGLCKRVRFRGSRCQRCEEICPEDAISLDPGPSISDSCSDCGLCQVACPTEVFQHEIKTDYYLLNRAADLLGRDAGRGNRERLVVRCYQAEDRGVNVLSLGCLGRMNENIFLGAALLGFKEIILVSGCCSECRLNQGERLYKVSMRAARVLLRAVGLEDVTIGTEDGDAQDAEILERRDLFRDFGSAVKDRFVSYVYRNERSIRQRLGGHPEREKVARLSSRKSTLFGLLHGRALFGEMTVEYERDFPWGAIDIDEKRCSACGICAAICPSGALFEESGDEYYTLYCRTSECFNCSLCVEACPENAIGFEERLSFGRDMVEAEARAAVRVAMGWCAVCGGEERGGESRLCPTCEKRQVHPPTLRV